MHLVSRTLSGLLALAVTVSARADDIDFTRDIRPILSDNCYHCHGPDEQTREADLRLDTQTGLFRVENEVAIVAPHRPEASELVRRVTSAEPDERMPPPDSQRSLSLEQIDLLKRWVQAGAPWAEHWSFRPIVAPSIPEVSEVALRELAPPDYRLHNAIDGFVLERLRQDNLAPASPAAREQLLRRVTLDLTGLPPTLEAIDAFLADESADAYETVVDRLLAARQYGENMAWDWLDAARYADTNGYQGDRERTMWPWRDWIVQAMNENLRFDDFTVWQLAGDLLPEATFEQKLATGFCRNHMINGEGGRIAEENRIEYIFDQLETVGTVWMGLTLQCCRCHDHKFDPLAQREYYQLFAFFNQTPVDGGGGDPQTPPILEAPSAEQRARLAELDLSIQDLATSVKTAEESVRESADATPIPDQLQQALRQEPARRSVAQLRELEQHFAKLHPDYTTRLGSLREVIEQREQIVKSAPRVMIMQEITAPRKTFVLDKGLYNQPLQEVSAEIPTIFPTLPTDAPRNRLTLARMLVDPQQPLVARVTVNRFWQHFFGVGLVKTTEDFGEQGDLPSHPQLLDWLAAEFLRSGWDVKHMHKLIVMSATYRQSAKVSPQLLEFDPENRLLARGPRFRMPSWMIRDHALAASGLLVDKMGGPAVNPYQPAGVWAEATFGNKKYEQGHGDQLYRRSLYTYWRRIVGPTVFFDAAKRQTCSVKPGRTNTPLHALTTLNDITYVEAARALAQRVLERDDASVEQRLTMAFRLGTSRRPTAEELEILRRRWERLQQHYAQVPEEAAQLLAIGESTRNEQLDLIEHAAYTGVCSLILNLDEALCK